MLNILQNIQYRPLKSRRIHRLMIAMQFIIPVYGILFDFL